MYFGICNVCVYMYILRGLLSGLLGFLHSQRSGFHCQWSPGVDQEPEKLSGGKGAGKSLVSLTADFPKDHDHTQFFSFRPSGKTTQFSQLACDFIYFLFSLCR